MKYYYSKCSNCPVLRRAQFIRVERNKMNPINYGSFVSIAYYKIGDETIGIVF